MYAMITGFSWKNYDNSNLSHMILIQEVCAGRGARGNLKITTPLKHEDDNFANPPSHCSLRIKII